MHRDAKTLLMSTDSSNHNLILCLDDGKSSASGFGFDPNDQVRFPTSERPRLATSNPMTVIKSLIRTSAINGTGKGLFSS
ncbi:hypothetical protein SLA2020_497100 [Shorea laevis]